MTHKLPALPYEYSALEPHIDTRTMAVHHDKHHQAYVDNLNRALEGYPELQEKSTLQLLLDLDSVPEQIRTAVRNNGGGHLNHTMFWNGLYWSGPGKPAGQLAEEIGKAFGSFDDFKAAFSQAATTLFGSGWVWLCVDDEGELLITTTTGHDNPVSEGLIPLLVLDVWEHAYYLKYENRRADYVAAWWNVVSWGYVSGNLTAAKVHLGARDAAEEVKEWAEDTWSKIEGMFSKWIDDD
jgi:Fe-Mn family superoxide dismutase